MPAHCVCLRCCTLVDTNVLLLLLYVVCCPVQGRLKAVLCLGYVDNVVFGAWFCAFVVCAEEKAGSKTKLRGCLRSSEAIFMASRSELMIQLALTVSPIRAPSQQSCSPRRWYSPVPWLGLRRAPVSRTCYAHTNTHTRASCCCCCCCCCCYGVAVLRLVVVVLSSPKKTKK